MKALTLLRITDNGPGISPQARMQLFRSASAPNSSATNGHGLLIARDLAERNGGRLLLAEVLPFVFARADRPLQKAACQYWLVWLSHLPRLQLWQLSRVSGRSTRTN